MGERSSIEWTQATWNPITGCSPVSAGCANCYAKRIAERFSRLHCGEEDIDRETNIGNPVPFSTIRFHPDRLDQPLRWKKPRRIFVSSMGDLFHKDVEHGWIVSVFSHIEAAPRHTFMILTKRPDRMLDHYQGGLSRKFPVLSNLWLGVTAENQEMADQRIPILLQTPAAKRFVSIEPMLGPVVLGPVYMNCGGCGYSKSDKAFHGDHRLCRNPTPTLDWVICGGESGPGARPMHPDWPRALRDQCREAGVPFFFKQWGEYGPCERWTPGSINLGDVSMKRVGKNTAGCLLDGREWKEFPEVKG